MKRIAGPILALLALAACDGSTAPPPSAAAGSSSAAAVTDCGTFELGQGDGMPEAATRCLVEAVRDGSPARLQVTRPTTEGDPIPVTYTAGADGRVEVLTDSRQDKFGPQTITRQFCTGPTAPQLTFAQCAEPTPSG